VPKENHIGVAVIGTNVYMKPVGLAGQENSLGVPDFLDAMFRAGCRSVSIDLRDCVAMDSTFLGVVAGAATAAPHLAGKKVVILNASEGAIRTLQRVGLLPLLCVHEGDVQPPEGIELRQIDLMHFPKTERERLVMIKNLHKELAELNELNRETFGSFIAMLEDELKSTANEPTVPDE